MAEDCRNGWQMDLKYPITGRLKKPRKQGLTMVLDKGLGVNALKDLLEISSEYIDFLKFSFGTSFVYPLHILKGKIKLARQYGLEVFPGGTLFEVALSQKKLNDYLFRAKQLGFTSIEISNGSLEFPPKLRQEAIYKANSLGFKVLTEVGKKDRANPLSVDEIKEQIEQDQRNGAELVIIEGRESGKGVSIYQADGQLDRVMLEGILSIGQEIKGNLIWETPLKKQQVALINRLGPNVNLGNIAVDQVIALEALRQGLRADTFVTTLSDNLLTSLAESGKSMGA